MRPKKLPDNKLDIIVPVFEGGPYFGRYAKDYPELRDIRSCNWKGDDEIAIHLITNEVPKIAKNATEMLSYYFKREFGFDSSFYEVDSKLDPKDRIFLLTQGSEFESCGVGVIGFKWREYSNIPHQYELAWVWIHPFLRRQGILTAYWNTFVKVYGPFQISTPLSKAMESFLKKVNYPLKHADGSEE